MDENRTQGSAQRLRSTQSHSFLSATESTIYRQGYAGNVVRRTTSKENGGSSAICRNPPATLGDTSFDSVIELWVGLGSRGEVRAYPARQDGVYLDIVFGPGQGQAFCELHHTTFRCRIRRD